MKCFPLCMCAAALLAGCQTMPDLNDTTNAELRFRVHYEKPALGSPNVEIVTSTWIEAGRCVFVATPFGVAANAADTGGIRSVSIGPSAYFDALKVRQLPGDVLFALPSPAEPTQGPPGATFPNPGNMPDSAVVRVGYSTAKAFDTVTLMATYEFAPGASLGALHGTVYNFGATTGVSQVYHFYVRPATNNPAEQPGMNCAVP